MHKIINVSDCMHWNRWNFWTQLYLQHESICTFKQQLSQLLNSVWPTVTVLLLIGPLCVGYFT